MITNEFEQLPYSKRTELFSEEDIKAWEFAASSLRWWEKELEELEICAGEGEQAKSSFEPKFGEILSAVARGLKETRGTC